MTNVQEAISYISTAARYVSQAREVIPAKTVSSLTSSCCIFISMTYHYFFLNPKYYLNLQILEIPPKICKQNCKLCRLILEGTKNCS